MITQVWRLIVGTAAVAESDRVGRRKLRKAQNTLICRKCRTQMRGLKARSCAKCGHTRLATLHDFEKIEEAKRAARGPSDVAAGLAVGIAKLATKAVWVTTKFSAKVGWKIIRRSMAAPAPPPADRSYRKGLSSRSSAKRPKRV